MSTSGVVRYSWLARASFIRVSYISFALCIILGFIHGFDAVVIQDWRGTQGNKCLTHLSDMAMMSSDVADTVGQTCRENH